MLRLDPEAALPFQALAVLAGLLGWVSGLRGFLLALALLGGGLQVMLAVRATDRPRREHWWSYLWQNEAYGLGSLGLLLGAAAALSGARQ